MTSIDYDDIFSFFLGEIDSDASLLSLSREDLEELEKEYLRKAASKPTVRRMFSIFLFDEEEKSISYEMKIPDDEESDKTFVMNVLGKGMMIEWMSPIVRSKKNLSQMFSGKEQNFYSQANHISAVMSMLEDAKLEQYKLISDRSSALNSYLRSKGES